MSWPPSGRLLADMALVADVSHAQLRGVSEGSLARARDFEGLWFKEQTREFTGYQLYQAYERQLDGFGELLRVFTVTWGWDSETGRYPEHFSRPFIAYRRSLG
jgi:hypothetical protein